MILVVGWLATVVSANRAFIALNFRELFFPLFKARRTNSCILQGRGSSWYPGGECNREIENYERRTRLTLLSQRLALPWEGGGTIKTVFAQSLGVKVQSAKRIRRPLKRSRL
uniref:Uncharacterized protein n=1 Tax=Ixodes ricinus TaxID=34613 RepID=A0A6B0UKB0_IXORI